MNRYEQIGLEIGKLVGEKNKAYGESASKTGSILQILYPNGIPVERFSDALLIIRVLDKITRLACGDSSAFNESPWSDIIGYAILGVDKGLRQEP